MKTTISTAVAAVAMVVGVAVAGLSQEQVPQAQRPGSTDAAAVTLTGCVARGTAADTYTLAETKKAGSTAVADAAMHADVVALHGTAVDMSKHVGHSVTLTGSYAKPDVAIGTSGSEKPAASAPSSATAAPAADKTTAKTFTVTSLKMVSPTC